MTGTRRHTFPAADLPEDIGREIRRLRQASGWSQADLASRSGISRETILCIEKSDRVPFADTVLRLLEALFVAQENVELGELVPKWPEPMFGRWSGTDRAAVSNAGS